jgi:hypothetical protein
MDAMSEKHERARLDTVGYEDWRDRMPSTTLLNAVEDSVTRMKSEGLVEDSANPEDFIADYKVRIFLTYIVEYVSEVYYERGKSAGYGEGCETRDTVENA